MQYRPSTTNHYLSLQGLFGVIPIETTPRIEEVTLMPEAQPNSQDAANQKKSKYKDVLIFTGIILLVITLFTLAAIYNIDIDNTFSLLFGYIIIGTLALPLMMLIAMAILRGISLLIGR